MHVADVNKQTNQQKSGLISRLNMRPHIEPQRNPQQIPSEASQTQPLRRLHFDIYTFKTCPAKPPTFLLACF